MDNNSLLEALGRVDNVNVGEIFRDYLRGATRQMLLSVMQEEVDQLCGPRYHPDRESDYKRGGSAEGFLSDKGVS